MKIEVHVDEAVDKVLGHLKKIAARSCLGLQKMVELSTSNGSRLQLKATDLESTLIFTTKAMPVDEGGELCSEGKPEPVVLPLDALRVAVGRGAFDLRIESNTQAAPLATVTDDDGCVTEIGFDTGPDAPVFPLVPDIGFVRAVGVEDTADLVQRLEWVAQAVAKDAAKPHLHSLCFDPEHGLVGVDSHRLHVSNLDEEIRYPTLEPDEMSSGTDSSPRLLLLPLPGVESLIELLRASKNDKLSIAWGSRGAYFSIGNYLLTIRAKTDTKFILWQHVVPPRWKDAGTRVELKASETNGKKSSKTPIQKALIKLQQVGKSRSVLVRINLDSAEQVVRLALDGPDVRFTAVVPADVRVGPLMGGKTVGINALYLDEVFPHGVGTLYFCGDPESAIVATHDLGIAVIMPVRL